MKKNIIITLSLLFTIISCKNQESEVIKFPNKDSELAILMRDLTLNVELMKDQIQEGLSPEILVKLEELHTAIPTDSNLRSNEVYTELTNSFIESIESLEETKEQKIEKYNTMLQTCIQCHKYVCPGPIKKIRKLRIQ